MYDSIQQIEIQSEYISLGQLLKLTNQFDSGGMIKRYLQDYGVLVNQERENRRGRKLFSGDTVKIDQLGTFVVKKRSK